MQALNIKQLEAFCAVVEHGSFTAASKALYLAQSTISGHVAALEKDLGITLLTRTGKKRFSLTEEGHKVYSYARAILQSCEDLSRELEEENSSHLTIVGSSIPVQYILPRMIADFRAAVPGCRIHLHSGDSEQVHQMLLNGGAQIGFAGAELDRKNMQYECIAEDPLVVIAPDTDRYRALRDRGATGNDLLAEPLIFREGGSGTQLAGQRYLTERGYRTEELNIVARIDSSEALLRAVECGMGCAVVSGLAAASRRDVLSFPLPGPGNSRQIFMLYPKNTRPSKITKSFMNFMLTHKR